VLEAEKKNHIFPDMADCGRRDQLPIQVILQAELLANRYCLSVINRQAKRFLQCVSPPCGAARTGLRIAQSFSLWLSRMDIRVDWTFAECAGVRSAKDFEPKSFGLVPVNAKNGEHGSSESC